MKKMFGRIKFLRIVEVGDAVPHPRPETKGLMVPVKVEVEADGVQEVKEFSPGVRPVYNQPDRWDIFTGI